MQHLWLRRDLSTERIGYRTQQLPAKLVTLLAHRMSRTDKRVSTAMTTSQAASIRDVPQRATDEDVYIFAAIYTRGFLIRAH
jgi:hypothetical protein